MLTTDGMQAEWLLRTRLNTREDRLMGLSLPGKVLARDALECLATVTAE